MNTASASEAVTTPSWSTPATSAATPSWPTSTGYEQYYNYYQTVPPPATTVTPVTTTTSSANYQQDYSQAWDEYYKAYYGQSYSTPAAPVTTAPATGTAQYPTNYSYDQYGYANFAAPPPNYYEAPSQSSNYDYTQPAGSNASSSYPVYNTAPTGSVPPTTNWSEPPPSFTQPTSYNNPPQQYEQPQPTQFSQPPPIPAYDNSMDQSNMVQNQSNIGEQFYDQISNKQQKFNNKAIDPNSNRDYKSNVSNKINQSAVKEASYLEQFPPPSFGSPVKSANRGGRGGGVINFNNNRGSRQQGGGNRNNTNNSNFNSGNRNPQFNRNSSYGNKNNGDRRQFGNSNNDYNDDNTSFNINKQNNMGNRRGNRGGFNRGRNMDNQSSGFQRDSTEPWYMDSENDESETNETGVNIGGFLPNNSEKKEFFHNAPAEKNQDMIESNFSDWNSNKSVTQHNPMEFEASNYSLHNANEAIHNQKRNFEAPRYSRNMDGGLSNQKVVIDNQEIPRINMPSNQLRNSSGGGYFPNNNNRQQTGLPYRHEARSISHSNTRQFTPRMNQNIPVNSSKPLMKLMDVIVQLSAQSPVIRRRQNMVDQWQKDIKEIHNRRMQVNYYWPIIKSALAPEIQDMLFVKCYNQKNIICELVLDDIFIMQSRGDNEEAAIESASKSVFDMFKNRVYIMTSTRDVDGEMVPGFCISSSPNGIVNLPPICRKMDNILNSAPIVKEPEIDLTIKPPSSKLLAKNSPPENGLFLVLESATNERDQSIASLVATARFNNSIIDYQHDKLPHAPHISLCVITIDGEEIDRHDARDYLVAKRQAADKVIAKLKQTQPQISLRLDKAKPVKKDEFKKEDAFENIIKEYLQNFSNSAEDILLKFDNDFSTEERSILTTLAPILNLSSKSEGKQTLYIFKQFPILEMKARLLSQGYCAQYQLIEKGSDIILDGKFPC